MAFRLPARLRTQADRTARAAKILKIILSKRLPSCFGLPEHHEYISVKVTDPVPRH